MAKQKKEKTPKTRKFRYYIINIKIRYVDSQDDLPSGEYARIFKEFYLSFISARSSRQKDCMITTQGDYDTGSEVIYGGQFAEFTNLNNKKWFHKQRKELDPNFRIPPEYAGNAAITEYVFIPSVHRFAYLYHAGNYINPYHAKTFFTAALNRHLPNGYIVQVDVESDVSTINRILEASAVLRLYIRVNYSNNDFSREMQEFVDKDMKASNTGELRINAIPKEGNSLVVEKSQILGGALESSVSNGETEATVIDANGKKQKLSTADMPRKLTIESTNDARINTLYNTIKNEYRQNENPPH